ncbi:Hint domain-containing protein, partial [Fangia hongkongensis]
TFQDRNGKVEQIHATPTHPFYVINKKRFIAIDQLSSKDQLLSAYGKEIQLVCPKGKLGHCGQRYNRDDKPILVYNIEVYQTHNYYVGRFTSLVHNMCSEKEADKLSSRDYLTDHKGNPSALSEYVETIEIPNDLPKSTASQKLSTLPVFGNGIETKFVLSESKGLKIAFDPEDLIEFYHNDLMPNQSDLLTAGYIGKASNDSEKLMISNFSGHYRPEANSLRYMKRFLNEKGIDDIEFYDFDNNKLDL